MIHTVTGVKALFVGERTSMRPYRDPTCLIVREEATTERTKWMQIRGVNIGNMDGDFQ